MSGMVKFSFLVGDVNWLDHGGKWISQKFNNGEFDYWLVKELHNTEENRDFNTKYLCTLSVVAPSQYEDFEQAFESCGWEVEIEDLSDTDKVEIIHSYSGGSQEWSGTDNNYSKLFRECLIEANLITTLLLQAYLYRQKNALGDNGWNKLKGTSAIDSLRSNTNK
jgi:hypothetical protein